MAFWLLGLVVLVPISWRKGGLIILSNAVLSDIHKQDSLWRSLSLRYPFVLGVDRLGHGRPLHGPAAPGMV